MTKESRGILPSAGRLRTAADEAKPEGVRRLELCCQRVRPIADASDGCSVLENKRKKKEERGDRAAVRSVRKPGDTAVLTSPDPDATDRARRSSDSKDPRRPRFGPLPGCPAARSWGPGLGAWGVAAGRGGRSYFNCPLGGMPPRRGAGSGIRRAAATRGGGGTPPGPAQVR